MNDDIIIRTEGLGKKYVIGHQAERERYVALRDVITGAAKGALQTVSNVVRGRRTARDSSTEEFWALRDVNFEVKRGDVLGIIGRNGAGKSTLLKILSRITEPTEGRVTIKGRVASLLEVGTGFHLELTGRENIFLNGAILGMAHSEIRRKFDEIVAFAEVEKFLDTPVKRYSSGMYVRLAFAVAAHLEPEILIVDEVLAVGDAEFQKKCVGKMNEVASGGRTVLFVSHNIPVVSSLCSKAILFAHGRLVEIGDTSTVVGCYVGESAARSVFYGRQFQLRADLHLRTLNGRIAVALQFHVTLIGGLRSPGFSLGINDSQGTRLASILSDAEGKLPVVAKGETLSFCMETEPIRLSPGLILVKAVLGDVGETIESHDDVLQLIVPDYSPFACAPPTRPRGVLFLNHKLTFHEPFCFNNTQGQPHPSEEEALGFPPVKELERSDAAEPA